MRKVLLVLVAVIAGFSTTSCASIFSAQHQMSIPVNSNMDDVEVYVNGNFVGSDVSFVDVEPKDIVTFKKEGYRSQSVSIKGKFNAVSLINLLDPTIIVGWIVDAATGNITKVKTKSVSSNLKKAKN